MLATICLLVSECRQEYTPYGRLIESNQLFHHKKGTVDYWQGHFCVSGAKVSAAQISKLTQIIFLRGSNIKVTICDKTLLLTATGAITDLTRGHDLKGQSTSGSKLGRHFIIFIG